MAGEPSRRKLSIMAVSSSMSVRKGPSAASRPDMISWNEGAVEIELVCGTGSDSVLSMLRPSPSPPPRRPPLLLLPSSSESSSRSRLPFGVLEVMVVERKSRRRARGCMAGTWPDLSALSIWKGISEILGRFHHQAVPCPLVTDDQCRQRAQRGTGSSATAVSGVGCRSSQVGSGGGGLGDTSRESAAVKSVRDLEYPLVLHLPVLYLPGTAADAKESGWKNKVVLICIPLDF